MAGTFEMRAIGRSPTLPSPNVETAAPSELRHCHPFVGYQTSSADPVLPGVGLYSSAGLHFSSRRVLAVGL